MVKVAVVGDDEQHLKTWSKLQEAEVLSIVPVKSTTPGKIAFQVNGGDRVEDVEELNLDVIDLCVPVEDRPVLIRQFSKQGTHIICASPLASTLKEASSIVTECKENQVHLYVGNKRRYSPEYVDANNQVRNGNIGRSGVIRLSRGAPHPGGEKDIFSELGIDEFEWLLWTFGDVERVIAKHIKRKRRNGSEVEYALLSIRMVDHSFAHVALSWAKTENGTSFELTGDKGMITHNSTDSNPISLQVTASLQEDQLEEMILDKSILQRQFAYVLDQAKKPNKPVNLANDALKSMQLVDAARKSAQTGQPVSIKEARWSYESRDD